MSTLKNSSYIGDPKSVVSGIDIFNYKKLLAIVILSYRQLFDLHIVDDTWEEDRITLELFVKINSYVINKNGEYIPIHQYPLYPKKGVGKPSTIDFVFRKGFHEARYAGFECKKLNVKKSHLFKEYIENGMMRFIAGKYAKEEKQGGMLAYIINGTQTECVSQVNTLLSNTYNFKRKSLLIKAEKIEDFEDIFRSSHDRPINNIDLFHLMLKFS